LRCFEILAGDLVQRTIVQFDKCPKLLRLLQVVLISAEYFICESMAQCSLQYEAPNRSADVRISKMDLGTVNGCSDEFLRAAPVHWLHWLRCARKTEVWENSPLPL
jgi:hypothetical protein